MAAEGWAGIALTNVTSTGNLKQLYPNWAPVGIAKATATMGQWVREPVAGELVSLQVQTDGTNGGTLELWDLSGVDAGADVSTTDVVTNAQLVALQARGLAKLIYSQNVVASGLTPPTTGYRRFLKGLAARFVAADGTCSLNMSVTGGFRLNRGSN